MAPILLMMLVAGTIAHFSSIFKKEQLIFSSSYNITSVLVPANGVTYIHGDLSDIPSIFFTVSDTKFEGGSCVYVLEGFAAYEVLEGGRDTTADYGLDNTIYFGARNGVYKYDAGSLSAKKFGPFHDDIIQIQKAKNIDVIFFLNSSNKMFKLEKNGTVKTRIQSIICATEFVLDTSNNLYYIACDDNLPHIVQSDGKITSYLASVTEDFKEVKLLRPAFVMERSVPFIADKNLYILYSNGTCDKKDLYIEETPTAYGVDAALYLVAAVNGKIYEFNVIEVLSDSMFRETGGSEWPSDITKIIMSAIETAKDGVFKDWIDALEN